ncbi:MAG: hypothetical protein QXU45_09695 [Candidatus Bathyarchaeia archaeon]
MNGDVGLWLGWFAGKVSSWFVKRRRDLVAKKVRRALLSIPFYREKLKKNSIGLHEVKGINTIEKLDVFLQKHKIEWVKSEDLIDGDFSSHLSLTPKSERTWVQYSSGYTLVERLRKGEKFLEAARKFRRKKVAFTENDLKLVINEAYSRGLERLFPNNIIPRIAIFSRFYVYGGSGTYPFASLLRISYKRRVIVFPYSEPSSKEQLCDYVLDSIENDTNGIIIPPSTLCDLGDFMVDNNLKYPNLRYIGTGGFKVTKEAVELGHEIGAQLIIDAYSVQECMPLGCIASGTISSLDRNWEPTEGLMVMGNLCHVRVVDRNGENVDEGEEGEIRITSPFEGTTLIDYAPGDVTKLLSYNSAVEFKGWRINLPYALLSYDIKRSHESSYVKIREYPMSLPILNEILATHCSYDYAIFKPQSKDELIILVPESIKKSDFDEICQKIRYIAYPPIYDFVRVKRVKEDKLRRIVYSNIHHKPHNIILEPSRQLEEEINAL